MTTSRLDFLSTGLLVSALLSGCGSGEDSVETTVPAGSAATLIAQVRQDFPTTLLLDNGDTLQGTVSPVACDQTLAVYKVMNAAGYEAAVSATTNSTLVCPI